MKKAILVGTIVASALSIGTAADAYNVGTPFKSGSNAGGTVSNGAPPNGGIPVGLSHDIDRRNCNTLGCSWLDGSNKNIDFSPDTVYRGLQSGSHDYRHQVSDGSVAGPTRLVL